MAIDVPQQIIVTKGLSVPDNLNVECDYCDDLSTSLIEARVGEWTGEILLENLEFVNYWSVCDVHFMTAFQDADW